MTDDVSEPSRTIADRSALGWFALGLMLGLGMMLAVMLVRGSTTAGLDATVVRSIVREEVRNALEETASRPNPVAQLEATAVPADEVPLGDNILGDPNAPVTMIEYSDFQCPFCGRYQREVHPQIYDAYIRTGKVKFAYKHFVFLGKESSDAARAAECAADQGKFWDYHDRVFAGQNGENQGAFNTANLIKFAGELKIDTAEFEACLTNDKTVSRVLADTAEGQRLGVRGTPHFLINGRAIVGAQPYEAFKQAIDAALKSAP